MKTTKPQGTVTMTLEEYNKIIFRLNRLENAVTVRKGYKNETILVSSNYNVIRDVIIEKVNEVPGWENYIMVEDFYQDNTTVANVIEKEEEQE
jgi:hypothetical protein